MEATEISAGGGPTLTVQVSVKASGACLRMSQSANSGLMPLLLGGATTLCASMEETQPPSSKVKPASVRLRIAFTGVRESAQYLALEPVC